MPKQAQKIENVLNCLPELGGRPSSTLGVRRAAPAAEVEDEQQQQQHRPGRDQGIHHRLRDHRTTNSLSINLGNGANFKYRHCPHQRGHPSGHNGAVVIAEDGR